MMKRMILMPLAMTIAAWTLPAMAANSNLADTACKKSADKMYESCRFENNEEFHATYAKCQNLGDVPKRIRCKNLAAETREEDKLLCAEQRGARKEVCDLLGEQRYDPEPLLDLGGTIQFVATPDGSNPYFSLQPGHTYVLKAGEDFEETVVVTVTDEVRDVLGVNCRVVVDIVLLKDGNEYVPEEVTDDFYAQAANGDVYYCGETSRNYEDGLLVDLDGSFQAGREYAKSGILIKAMPMTDDGHRQEYSLGEAEDVVQYVAGADAPTFVPGPEGGENPNFPCGGQCVKTEEFNPLEPESGEFKYYLAGTGFVLGVALEDGVPTGERDEMLCVGDSIDILETDPNCGIDAADLAQLQDALCRLSPDAFCAGP